MKNIEEKGMVKAESLLPKQNLSEELEVLGYIKQGLSKQDIRTIYQSWSATRFSNLWKKAMDAMKQAISEQEEAKAEAVMMYRDLYAKAYRVGNIKECRNLLDSMVKCQGLTKDGVNIATEFVTVWK